MTEDVDMDAPQISTLREETTPEPNPTRSKFRVKLLIGDKGEGSKASSVSSKHDRGDSEDEDEEEDDEDEEDQLIDDDDEELARPVRAIPLQTVPTRGSPGRRGGRGRGNNRRGRGSVRASAPSVGPGLVGLQSMSLEVVPPPEIHPDTLDPNVAATVAASGSVLSQSIGRKKPGPAKGSAQRGNRKKISKPSAKGTVNILKDADAESVSEAASSPAPHDDSPEPENPLSSVMTHLPRSVDDAPLDGVPLPVYPLPSKPFPVQPPPKIGTGFAPVIPLDKSGKPVRKWRQVHREVRGIAGGRWFIKSWVGEKESEFAAAVAASQVAAQNAAADGVSAGLSLPKLPAMSIAGTGRGRGRGARHNVADHSSTVASSRAGSALPDSISAQFSKKRASGPSTPSLDIPAISTPVAPPPAAS